MVCHTPCFIILLIKVLADFTHTHIYILYIYHIYYIYIIYIYIYIYIYKINNIYIINNIYVIKNVISRLSGTYHLRTPFWQNDFGIESKIFYLFEVLCRSKFGYFISAAMFWLSLYPLKIAAIVR